MSEEQSVMEIQTFCGDNGIIDGSGVLVLILQALPSTAILWPNQRVNHKSSLSITVRILSDTIISETTILSWTNLPVPSVR